MFAIKNLDQIFNKKIVKSEVNQLGQAGDNYASQTLSLKVHLCEDTCLDLVAKSVPKNDFLTSFFKPEIIFKKELLAYQNAFPTLQQFSSERLEFFPEFYGGRMGLKNSDFDENALILLENLQVNGFELVDRRRGFDFETSVLILRQLAKLHASALAIRLKEPKIFQEKILPCLEFFTAFEHVPQKMTDEAIEDALEIIQENINTQRYFKQFKEALISRRPKLLKEHSEGAWATFIHKDLWVNNIMVNKTKNKIKILDYQMIGYGSPGEDLIFFLFGSVQNEVIKSHFEQLLQEYFNSFLNTLQDFKINPKTYSFKALQNELEQAAKSGTFYQLIIMLNPIFASKDSVATVEDLKLETFERKTKSIPEEHKTKLRFIVEEFSRRNWL